LKWVFTVAPPLQAGAGGGCIVIEGVQEPDKENVLLLRVQGGVYKDNVDDYLAGAMALWIPLNASIKGAVFENNKVRQEENSADPFLR
jgi:hypothetical protein